MRISAVPTLLFRPDWLPQEVTALCGVVFPPGDAVHAGVYAKADVWYLQSAPSGIGAVPEQDGYWEVVVSEASEYYVIVMPDTLLFEPVIRELQTTGAVYHTPVTQSNPTP